MKRFFNTHFTLIGLLLVALVIMLMAVFFDLKH